MYVVQIVIPEQTQYAISGKYAETYHRKGVT